MGAGMGLAMAPATESVMGSLPKEKAGVGSAMSDTTRELGGTLGVAVGGSALAAVYASKLDAAAERRPAPAPKRPTSPRTPSAARSPSPTGPGRSPNRSGPPPEKRSCTACEPTS